MPAPGDAAAFTGSAHDLADGVTRAERRAAVRDDDDRAARRDAPMIDWWFGWHLPHTERYRLWHPIAHMRSVVKEDRSALAGSREVYVNNTSFVDEYIGPVLMKLAITFMAPAELGFSGDAGGSETVICARTADRSKYADAGSLVHRVFATPGGARMQSLFWLGEIMPKVPVIGPLAAVLLNRPFMRRQLVPDSLGLALLRHCSEEMNHLAKFLPRLHRDAGVDRGMPAS